MFRTIVLLDSSALTERIIPVAAHIAQGVGGRLILLRMLAPPTRQDEAESPGPGTAGRGGEPETTEAKASLERLLQRYRLPGMEIELQFGIGVDTPALLAAAHRLRADLLILVRAARTGLAPWKREQDLPFIVRHTLAPVLLIPEQAPLPPLRTPVRVLAPLDGSRLAETALAPAASLAAALAAPAPGGLHLLRVIPDLAQQRNAAAYLRVVARRVRQSILAQGVPSISWSVICHLDVVEALSWVAEQGEDARQMVRGSVARDIPAPFERCHLIALTTHGRRGLERWTLGSVTERLIRWGRRPLLIVPPPGPAEAAAPTAGEITEAELHAWLGVSKQQSFFRRPPPGFADTPP